jgi:mono/diheme cytochrome c family protein/peroxiredoxin
MSQGHEAVDRARNDRSKGRGARSMVVLVFAGLTSFALAGAVGWRLGGARGPEATPITPTAQSRPSAPVATAAQRQKQLLFQVHCARCHGTKGHGDGPDAPLLKSRPRDFSLAGKDVARDPRTIRKAIADGVPGTPMTAFGQLLSARELDLLWEHVQSLSETERAGDTADRSVDGAAGHLARAGFASVQNRRAPPLELRGEAGETLSLGELGGRLVLVVFWGTTCSACLDELPDLEELAKRFGDRGLSVLAVCVEEAVAGEAFRIARGRVKGLKVYTDLSGSARLGYDIQALPTAVLIDESGNILGRATGARKWSSPELRSLIEGCLPINQTDGGPGRVPRS